MEIRDGLAVSLLADFEAAIIQVPSLLRSLEERTDNPLLADARSAETLALSRLAVTQKQSAICTHRTHGSTARHRWNASRRAVRQVTR